MISPSSQVDGNQLVVATTNKGKLLELSTILPATTRFVSLRDAHLDSPEETGRTFLDNAVLKAQHACVNSGLPAIADDSGLEVDALDGRPGVHSARYAGPDASDEENNAMLVRELKSLGAVDSTAKFRCAVAFATPDGYTITAEGTLHGRIIESPRGANGFGYDPHFEINDPDAPGAIGRTAAELSLDEKNGLSHRARAYRDLVRNVRNLDLNHPAVILLVTK